MKKTVALAMALVLLVVAVSPVMAEGGQHGRGQVNAHPFVLVGLVTAIDLGAGTITVDVRAGNPLVEDQIGQLLTVETTDSTKIREYGADPGVFITLKDVVVGQLILIRGQVDGDVFTAELVVVDVPCTCPKVLG